MSDISAEINLGKGEAKSLTEDPVFMKQALDSAPGMIAIVRDSDLKVIFVNSVFESYLGYSFGDLATADLFFTDLTEPYQYDRLRYQLQTVVETVARRNSYVIYKLKDKKGKIASFYLFASPVENVPIEKGLHYNFFIQPDLSNWNLPFTSFATRELFLEQFQSDNFGTFEWIIGVDRAYWSKGVYKIYEVDEAFNDITLDFVGSFVHPADKARTRSTTVNSIANGATSAIEFRIITRNNRIKIINSLARVIKNDKGEPIKFIGSIREITNQRTIESELKYKVDELYQSNRELEEFAFVASHDMQEPLRKITTFSSMLLEKYKDALEGDGMKYLSRITNSAENMKLLINDLLEFSRISKTEQPFEPVSLQRVLRHVVTELELSIEETGTVVNISTLPDIDAIPSQMMQLFTNVLSNSIKFRKPDCAPVITIVTEPVTQPEKINLNLEMDMDYHRIIVSDNGIGFDDIYADRIFKVFQRLHGKSEYPGTGIGLAICKKILEHHNGLIFAENVPDIGAKFIIILPAAQKKANYEQIN